MSSDTEKLVNLLENNGVDASVGEHLKSTFDHEDIGDVIDHIQALQARIEELEAFVAEQAEDEGLWFKSVYASEAYLQSALRQLHRKIEGG